MKKKILVIEDNESLRENIVEILSRENFDVKSAVNGKVGLDLAKSYLPDLIVCDIMMPEMDGYEVLSAIKKSNATALIPFIFLTVKNTMADLRIGMGLGADDYITKPFNIDDLLSSVKTRLNKLETIKENEGKELASFKKKVGIPITSKIDGPAKSISHLTDFILKQYLELDKEEIAEIVSLIRTTANNLSDVVRKTLYYYKLESLKNNESELSKYKIEVTDSIKRIIEESAIATGEKYHRVNDLFFHLENGEINFPEEFFKLIVHELIDNAFKYSSKRTQIKIIGEQGKDAYYHLTIQDEGVGMTAENIAKIAAYAQFEPNNLHTSGLGLGLYIAQGFVEIFGGEIEIKSKPGIGSIFKIALPLNGQS
ncbi:hybrid sensor histidine kinase/response regulator [Penaeicola halotolerans]|uniref:hybrid sensor histidine kinase/response regulator n=1 Tax=Penaeicola halotolerans TaxID=2793196 RepID=UPI001CF8037A|nr:response regulator [Penaeicola halotolerans]